ncbi:MAG: GxxExxY protein [Bacteroidota bacterium]
MTTKKILDELTYQIIGAAIEVHKSLGPGLLESVYHKCMKRELFLRHIKYTSEQVVSLDYKGEGLETELRCDLMAEDLIAVEFKSIESIAPIHEAKLLTYMNLLKVPKGIIINFNCLNLFREGQRTFVNDLFRALPEK